MTTKRPTPSPKRSSASARPASDNSAWLPLALGCSFPLAATILDILGQGLPLSLGSIIAVQQAQPLHWLLDLVPVAMLCLPTGKKPTVSTTPLAAQQPAMRGSTTSLTTDSPTQSPKAITTLQNELTSVKSQLTQVSAREATLNNLIDNAKDAILTLSMDGTITSVNRSAEEMFGWTQQEMLGHSLNNMLALPSVPQFEEHLTHILSDPSAPAILDLEFVHSNGTGLWAEGCSSVVRDATNQPTSLFVIYRDLKHRQPESAGRGPISHTALFQQQDPSQPQLDQQPQISSSSADEVSQSGALKIPIFLTALAPAAPPLSEGEDASSKAAIAVAPPLAEIGLQKPETSSEPVQFTFVNNESGSDTRVPLPVSSPFLLNEETVTDSQEVNEAPVQFAFVDDESTSPAYITPSVVTHFTLDEDTTAEAQEVSSPPVQFTLVDDTESTSPHLSPSAPPLLSLVDKPPLEMSQPSSSPFNFSEALSNIGGDETLLAELASIFLEEYPDILKNVRAAVGSNDGDALLYYAHALKGSVSNFVAKDAEGAARKLEQIGREGDLTHASEVLSQLETALSRLTPALSDLAIQGAA